MAEKDVSIEAYFENKDRIADLCNVFILHGKRLFLANNIQDRGSRNFLPNNEIGKKRTIEINKDIVYEAGIQMKTTIVALENQSDIHYAMPVRVMSGDSANYHNQWTKIKKNHGEKKDLKGAEFLSGFSKGDKLIPAATIVVYLGEEEWDGPRCLKDMLDLDGLPQELIDFIVDYPMYLLEVRKYEDTELFETDMRLVFGFLQRDTDENRLNEYILQNKEEFCNLAEDAFDVICNFSKVKYLVDHKKVYKTETGGMDMCKALDDMVRHGEERGEKRGEKRGLDRGIEGLIKICQELGMSVELVVQKIMLQFAFSEDKATEYIQKYWN